jgi:predicted DNA-binding transcriptional regulator YafY
MNTFLRRLEILNFLRTQHQAVSTEDILNHLLNAGYLDNDEIQPKSQLRLIQRDLNFLLGEKTDDDNEPSLTRKEHSSFEDYPLYDNDFGLYLEKGPGKSLFWKLSPYQQLTYDFERMPAFMALALSVSEKHLKQVLPSDTRAELQKLFEQAQLKLAQSEQKLSSRHYQRLTQSVEFFQRGQRLHGADFHPSILDTIYRAILLGKRLTLSYKTQQNLKEYDIHPYGVVIMLPKLYLIAKKHEDSSFRSFLIHKIDSVTISTFPNHVPEDFALRTYLEQGHMDVYLDSHDKQDYQLLLELRTHPTSALLQDLNENPISADQQLSQIDQQTWQLSATVRRTVQLRNWLMALGNSARILSPTLLRDDFLAHLAAITARYSK